jgi:hypothetical protein
MLNNYEKTEYSYFVTAAISDSDGPEKHDSGGIEGIDAG